MTPNEPTPVRTAASCAPGPALLRRLGAVLALAVVAVAAVTPVAHARTLDLETALAQAERTSAVVTARLDAEDAERDATRTDLDPLALRMDRLQAEQTAVRTRAAADRARFEAYRDVANAYVQALQASAQRELAEAGLALAERGVAIARLRFERGGATELEVRDAENERAEAANGAAAARQGEALALRSLRSLIGLDAGELEPVPDRLLATTVPAEEELVERLDASGPLLQALHGVEAARVGLELLDPSYAPAAQIERTELQLEQAREGAREARRGLELQLRSLIDRIDAARDGVAQSRETLEAARDREAIERRRLDAGLIAEVQFDQTVLNTLQAELGAMQARHDLLAALFELQAQTGIAIEGIDAF